MEEAVVVDEAGKGAGLHAEASFFEDRHRVQATDDNRAGALRSDGHPVDGLSGDLRNHQLFVMAPHANHLDGLDVL